MDLEEQLRKARVFSDVSDSKATAFANRTWQQVQDRRANRPRRFATWRVKRQFGEYAAAVAAVVVVIGGFGLYEGQRSGDLPFVTGSGANGPVQIGTATVDPATPGTFSRATLLSILAHLNQYNVTTKPQNHEVYVLTGGLGTADPQVDGWDSGGNMSFQVGGTFYDLREQSQGPAGWRLYSSTSNGGLVPWVQKDTTSGQVYFEWHVNSGMTKFYFKKGSTYVYLSESPGPSTPPKFPEGIIRHLVPIGNPVTK